MEHTYIYALHDPRDWSIVYVGKTNSPFSRLKNHRIRIKNQNLQMSILQTCPQSQWQIWERFWIATVRYSGAFILNTSIGGEGNHSESKQTEAHKNKIRIALLGRKKSESHIATMRVKKKLRSAEHQEKIAAANRGKKRTALQIEKIIKVHTGRKRSEESKLKMRIASRNRWDRWKSEGGQFSLEHRANLSKAQIGRLVSPETRAKISAAALKRSEVRRVQFEI